MAEVEIRIGGRSFRVACQPGEEPYLQSAAGLLDAEASSLVGQLGRMPEAQMLLMSGLMLADRTAALDERLRAADAEVAALRVRLAEIESAPPPEPERIEVPVLPRAVLDAMAEIAARAEAVAAQVEDRAGTGAGG